jgi:hypothetical protein
VEYPQTAHSRRKGHLKKKEKKGKVGRLFFAWIVFLFLVFFFFFFGGPLPRAAGYGVGGWMLEVGRARGAEEKKKKKRRTYLPTFFTIF